MRGGGGVAGVAEWAAPPFPLNGANVAERGQPQTLPAQLRGGAGSESRPPKSQGTCGRNWTGWPSRAEPRSWTCHCGCRAPPATWPLQGGGGQPAGSQRVPAASSRGRRVGRAAERAGGRLQEEQLVRPSRIQSVHEEPLHEPGRGTRQGGQRASPAPSQSVAPPPIRSTATRFPSEDDVQASSRPRKSLAPSAVNLTQRPCLWAEALPHSFSSTSGWSPAVTEEIETCRPGSAGRLCWALREPQRAGQVDHWVCLTQGHCCPCSARSGAPPCSPSPEPADHHYGPSAQERSGHRGEPPRPVRLSGLSPPPLQPARGPALLHARERTPGRLRPLPGSRLPASHGPFRAVLKSHLSKETSLDDHIYSMQASTSPPVLSALQVTPREK